MEDKTDKDIIKASDVNANVGSALMPIENLIYVIRGQQVMLDSDLARLYGVETKYLKRAVKSNISRFPADFMMELSLEELENLRT